MDKKLALYGGTPVRDSMLAEGFPGARMYDEEEAKAAYEVCIKKAPFRFYGPNLLGKANDFEAAFSKRIGSTYALGVTSCTAALVVSLKAAEIGPGDKVIVPACTFPATAGAVICAGAVPVFADVDDSLNIDPNKIGSLVDKYTKAVITVPIIGNPCQMDEIMVQAKKHRLTVIEDVAQSCGSALKGKPMGSWGDLGAFSLQVNKIISTGDGGVVVTDNDKLYERAVRYHDQGMFRQKEGFLTNDASDVFIGQNYRMSEITAAVGLVQLNKLNGIIAKMKKIKTIIKQELKDIGGITFRRIIDEEGDAASGIIFFLPDKEKADLFNKAMFAENIPCTQMYGGRPAYMIPQIFYQKTADRNGFPFNQFEEKIVYTEDMCPNAIELMPKSAMFQLEPCMTEKDIEDIITAVRKVSGAVL